MSDSNDSYQIRTEVVSALTRACIDTQLVLRPELGNDPNWQNISALLQDTILGISASDNIDADTINNARAIVLDVAEQKLLQRDNWHHIRKRLLRIFGHRGLEGRLLGSQNGFGVNQ